MKIYKLSIILLLVSFITSCSNDVLVEEPTGFVAPSQFFNTEQEAEAALFGVYDFLHDADINDFYWLLIGDLGTDISVTRSIPVYNTFQFYEMEAPTGRLTDVYRKHFEAIGAANTVIQRIGDSNVFTQAFKDEVVAEAKYLRAYYYFKLTLVYGDVPLWLNELNLDEAESLPRTSLAEVRSQIIQDLTDAESSLPQTRAASDSGRITSWAAKALMARVYLFEKDWTNALSKANDVITNSGHSLIPSYEDLFDFNNHFNNELIHVIPKATDIQGSAVHSFSSARNFDEGVNVDFSNGIAAIRPDGVEVLQGPGVGGLFQGWGIYQTIAENYDSFETGDTRKDLWWHDFELTDGTMVTLTGGSSGSGGYYNRKFLAFDETPNNGNRDIPVTRLGEMYLIAAEAENELNGPNAAAYGYINEIRRRAFGDNTHDLPTGLSKTEFQDAIIDENRFELGGEGLRRWYLNHWGFEALNEAVQFAAGSNPTAAQNVKSHHVLFKIPEEEIVKNPDLTQNPGY